MVIKLYITIQSMIVCGGGSMLFYMHTERSGSPIIYNENQIKKLEKFKRTGQIS